MSQRVKVYISIGEWQYKLKYSIPYTGYVIGVGYAYVTYRSITEEHKANQTQSAYQFFSGHASGTTSASPFLDYNVVAEQHLDTSEKSIEESFPPTAGEESGPLLSAKVRTAKWALLNYTVAQDVGEWELGSNNISSMAVRFVTRDGLIENAGWKGEGTERNAFRHALWQGYITNKYGQEIAAQIGNVHEDNPNANISQRHFNTLEEADQIVDLLNNRIGRDIGKQNRTRMPMNTMALKVLNVFYTDGLYTAQKTAENTYYIDRTTITQEQYEQLKTTFETLNHLGRTEEEQTRRNREIEEKRKQQQEELEQRQRIWGTMK